MTYVQRMTVAMDAEQAVLAGLHAQGFKAYPFGQGQLPKDFRIALHEYTDHLGRPSLMRWFPDIIAAKSPVVVVLDVKAENRSTENYAIECKALEACEAFQDRLFTPYWFIFPDLRVMTSEIVRKNHRMGPPTQNGSGTPYVLVPKTCAISISVAWDAWKAA